MKATNGSCHNQTMRTISNARRYLGQNNLGRNLSPMPQPREKHSLVTTGKFGWILRSTLWSPQASLWRCCIECAAEQALLRPHWKEKKRLHKPGPAACIKEGRPNEQASHPDTCQWLLTCCVGQ
eukprot:1144330-Pelagomonas_calceolata.AAC.3